MNHSPLSWPGILCGFEAEAIIARQFMPLVALSGGRSEMARQRAQALLDQGASGLVSFGIAGGLDPDLKAGDLVIASHVTSASGTYAADAGWLAALTAALPGARCGHVLGSDEILHHSSQKAGAFRATGALAVDMESHIVADVAQAAGRPYAVIRAIADKADFDLPMMVAQGLTADGKPNLGPILVGLARAPWQLPALMATGKASERALQSLLCRGGVALLGLGLGGMDLA